MPTFSYKGYDFEVNHTPSEEEFSQMSAYVDTLPPKEVKGNKPKASIGTAIKSSFAQVGNMFDLAGTTLAGGSAALFGDDKAALRLADEMEERRKSRNQWANPEGLELSTAGKVAGTVATLPMQMVGMGLSPVETTRTALESGESNSTARKAGLIDAAGNAIGIALPGFKQGSMAVRAASGAGANVAQELAAKKAIQGVMETEQGKNTFAPTMDDALVAGIVGGGLGASMGRTPKKPATKIAGIRADASPKAPDVQKAPVTEPEQLKLFDQFEERSPVSKYQTEMAPDMWRVDENGIPIRADLSMEVQNLQQPLQRNLFGDELDVNFPRDPNATLIDDTVMWDTDLEMNSKPLTQSIDEMPQLPWDSEREAGIGLLNKESPASPELEMARTDADMAQFLQENKPLPLGSKARKEAFIRSQQAQRGVIDPDVFLKDFPEFLSSKIKDTAGQLKVLFRGVQSDYDGPERPMLGTVGEGIYLTESKTLANNYAVGKESGRHVKAAYVDMKNPFELEMGSPEHRGLLLGDKTSRKQFSDMVKGAGYDGVIIKNGEELKEVMAFKPEQVQNAFSTPSSRVPKGQKGGVLVNFDKKIPGSFTEEIEALNRQVDEVGRRYVVGELSHEEMMNSNRELINKRESVKLAELRSKESVGAKTVSDIFPGYKEIPEGTKVMAKSGLTYAEPTRGTVVGTKSFRYGEEAYNLPLVDFGDGRERAIMPGDVTEVFGGPKTPFNFKKQGGGLKIDWSDEASKMETTMLKAGSTIPDNPAVADTLATAKTEKDGKLWTYTQSGGTSAAMKSGSTLITEVSRTVQNALKKAELQIRDSVFPAENSFRKLSKQEIGDLHDVFKDEMFQDYRFDGEVLAKHLSVKQLEAYTKMREMFDVTLSAQNAARVAQGKKPITASEAYMSSRWSGDFRQPVYDADGKLVWYLADATQRGLDKQIAVLKQDQPDLVIDTKKGHVVKSLKGGTDIQSMYSTMLDILGRDDPAVLRVKEMVELSVKQGIDDVLAQEKHFKHKGNIRGFVGDRPGKTNEAVKMFEQQIQYAKNAFKWSEMQKSGDTLKGLLSDEELQSSQPNNMKFAREYVKNALGQGEGQVARALDDAFRSAGISPEVINKGLGGMKSFFIMQKLALSAGYTISNIVQTANVVPYLANLSSQGYKGNPVTAVAVGASMGPAMAMSHYIKALGSDYLHLLPNQFFKDAFKYAEENGVTARSVYDEAPLETGFNPASKVANMASKTMTIPESFVRATAFMTYAQMLKDSGKFTDKGKLFQKAEELVNASMVDYRETERPLMFSKAGTVGNVLNTLQTYPMSFYNQWLYMGGEAAKGRPAGFMAMAATQYAIAGAMGLPGFDDADKLWKWFRDNHLSISGWNAAMKNKFLADPKLWLMENLGEGAVYGALSAESGVGLTSRVAAPGGGAMLQSPAGPPLDILKQVGNLAGAAGSVDDSSKWAQSAISSSPTGLQGLVETLPFMKDVTYTEGIDGKKTFMKTSDLSDRKGGYARDENEVDLRRWGLRSQKEVVTRDVAYSAANANLVLTRKSSELIDHLYSAARRGDTKRVGELRALYLELTGKDISETQITNQIKEELQTDLLRTTENSNTPRKIVNTARALKFLGERQP